MATLETELTAIELVIGDIDRHLLLFEDSPTLKTIRQMSEFMRKGLISESERKKEG